MSKRSWYAPWMAVTVLAAAARLQGAAIMLTGDLGSVTQQTPFLLAINSTMTTPFSHIVPGRGLITADVVTTNTSGTQFDMVITNLSFQGTNSPTGGTYISFAALQYYTVPQTGGTYSASHFVGGTWSTDVGNFIICDSLHDLAGGSNTSLPTLSFFNTNGIPSFGVPLAGTTVLNQSPSLIYSIRTELQMFIGGDGFISLPNSYDLHVNLVPAPGGAAMLVLGGVMAARRQRSGQSSHVAGASRSVDLDRRASPRFGL